MKNDKSYRPIFAPPHDVVTGNQLQHLLSAARVIHGCLMGFDDEYVEEPHKNPALDGGVKMAAEQTFIKICGRIDGLLEEGDRWSMKNQDTLEEELTQLFRAQNQATQLSAVHMMKSMAPSKQHGALLYKLSSEAWVAYTGDLRNENDSILAIGTCPDEAFKNYDMVCMGKMSERAHQKLFTDLLGQIGKERSQLDESTVVPGRDGGIDGIIEPGEEAEGDSPALEPDDQGGPEEDREEPPPGLLPPASSFPPSC